MEKRAVLGGLLSLLAWTAEVRCFVLSGSSVRSTGSRSLCTGARLPWSVASSRSRPSRRARGTRAQPPARRSARLFMSSRGTSGGGDPYTVLGLAQTATESEIKRAYRRLALKFHPDVDDSPEAKDKFIEIVAAYEILSDPSKRTDYDRKKRSGFGAGYGSSAGTGRGVRDDWRKTTGGAAGSRSGGAGVGPGEMPKDVDDSFGQIFNDLFGGAARTAVGAATKGAGRVKSGGGGILEDLVEFLEGRLDGFSDEETPEFSDLLRAGSVQELRQDLEGTQTLLDALGKRLSQAQVDLISAEAKLRDWAAQNGPITDVDALDKQAELISAAAALKARQQELLSHQTRAERRKMRVQNRLREMGFDTSSGTSSSASSSSSSRSSSSSSRSSARQSGTGPSQKKDPRSKEPNPSQRTTQAPKGSSSSSSSSSPYQQAKERQRKTNPRAADIESELEKMKRDMGL